MHNFETCLCLSFRYPFILPPMNQSVCPIKGSRNHGPGGLFSGFLVTKKNQKARAARIKYNMSIVAI